MVYYINSIEEFRSLVDYYISCLEKEDLLSLTFNFRSEGKKFHSKIIKEEQLFLQKKEQIKIKKTPEIEGILKNYKLLQGNNPLFYGFPLFMDSDGGISPIFFVEILFEEKDDSIIFTKESVTPEFNHYILTKHDYPIEEIDKIRSEIEEKDDFNIKLEKVISLLNLEKKIISSELEQAPLIVRSSPQLINKAILYSGERTGFTKGLIDELQKLKKLSQHQLESTSLGILFDKERYESSKNKKHLLEIFNLNGSQEKAVENAFSNKISVITGPPGTGKSQVVLNIIANAVWNDKTVLFASKNNRAVDVVNDKLKSILSQNLIVRMGSSNYRRNAKLQIYNLFKNKDSLKMSTNFEDDKLKIKDINKEMNYLKEQLEDRSETNDEIEELLNRVDNLAKEIPEKLYNQCKDDEFEAIDKFKLERDINNFENISFIRKIIKKIFPSFYLKKEQKIFQEYYNKLGTLFKEYLNKNIKLNTEDIEKTLRLIFLFKQIELLRKEINAMNQKLAKLDSAYNLKPKIEKLQKERIKLSGNIFESYWFEKLKKTSFKDENCVTRYLDASEKLEKYIENYSLWKQLVSEQEYELQGMLSFLPIWIVTNLSAKNSLPLKENLFDLLVIDESSQCDIASALPLLYRAKQVVIIGDPKQLKHISLLKDREDKKIASENKIPELFLDYAYSKNSLYDIAERTIKNKNRSPILLNQHYRSHRDIITFSNEHYYEKKLNIMTDENNLISDSIHLKGIEWVDVQGKTSQTKSPYNKEEATEIIKVLLQRFKKSKLKIGVVTLFRAHMELIADKIRKTKELNNLDITVGTTHKFQGDEKDVIIFSLAVSDGAKQTTLNWIHTTTQLLNVAVTRARSVLIIVGDKKTCYKTGGLLKNLVEYVESVESKKQLAEQFDSPAEEELFEALTKEGIKVIPQHEIKITEKKYYRLDFALFINGNKYDLEVDGDKAHSQKIESDILRDIHLRMDGWKIRRFPASKIHSNINEVVEEIKRLC